MSPRPAGRRVPALLLVAAAVLAPFALPAPASAEEGAAGTAAGTAAETVVGELVQAWPEAMPGSGHDHDDAEPLTWVETAEGEAVPVSTADVAELPVGSTVELTVGAAQDDGAGDDGAADDARAFLAGEVREAAPVAAATPSNPVTVVRVVPAGGVPDGTTVAALAAAVDGPVSRFWAGQTGGAVRFGVTHAHPDWVTTAAGCEDPAGLWAEAAAATGFQAGPGRHLVVYVSSRPSELAGCSAGLAQVGTGPGSGGRVYVRSLMPALIAHELGHNMGLGHSSGRQCDGALETGECRTAGYRDYYDVMGASWEHLGSLNAAQADRLGVLPAADRQDLAVGDAAATVTLAPLGAQGGTRALRLTAADGAVYWLENRTATGQDGWLSGAANRFGLDSGVLLHRAGEHTDTALLLDGTPSASAGWDGDLQAALPVGVPVAVGGGAFTVTVQAVAGSATLLVQPAAHAVPAPPAGTGSGPAPEVQAGTAGATGGTPAGAAAAAPAPEAAPVPGTAPAEAAVPAAAPADPVPAPALEAAAQSSSAVWLLPLVTGLAVTGTVLAGWRAVRLRGARR